MKGNQEVKRIAVVFGGPTQKVFEDYFGEPKKERNILGDYVHKSLDLAYKMWAKKEIDRILCVGGSETKIDDRYNNQRFSSFFENDHKDSQAEAMRQCLWLMGVPINLIEARGNSMDTIGNVAIDFWPWYQEHSQAGDLYFIGSRIHLRRIKLTLRKLAIQHIKDMLMLQIGPIKQPRWGEVMPKIDKNITPPFYFVDCGYKEPFKEWCMDFVCYILTIFDPLGKKWPWTFLRNQRKKSRLATGR